MKKIGLIVLCALMIAGCAKPNKEESENGQTAKPTPIVLPSEKPNKEESGNGEEQKNPVAKNLIKIGRYTIEQEGYSLMIWINSSDDTGVTLKLFKQIEDLSVTLLDDATANYNEDGIAQLQEAGFDFLMKMIDGKLEIEGSGKEVDVKGKYEMIEE